MNLPGNLEGNLKEIILKAGEILLSHFKKGLEITRKLDNSYVTKADLESDNFLRQNLSKVLNNASFLTEESGQIGTNDFCWVIDPLDGTSNFAHSIAYFCISVALTYKGQTVLGLIYDPIHSELFYAQKDVGVFLNEKPIVVSQISEFKDALIAAHIPYDLPKKIEVKQWDMFKVIRDRCFAIRVTGASGLDQAYVACGRLDASFYYNNKWWDVAAGHFMINLAGGKTSDMSGGKIAAGFKSYVSGSPRIHKELIEQFSTL